jgi:hypothetical protein
MNCCLLDLHQKQEFVTMVDIARMDGIASTLTQNEMVKACFVTHHQIRRDRIRNQSLSPMQCVRISSD